MSDVSTYTLASKVSMLETRVESIEKQRLEGSSRPSLTVGARTF